MGGQLTARLNRHLLRDAGVSGGDYGVLVSLSEAPQGRLRAFALGPAVRVVAGAGGRGGTASPGARPEPMGAARVAPPAPAPGALEGVLRPDADRLDHAVSGKAASAVRLALLLVLALAGTGLSQ